MLQYQHSILENVCRPIHALQSCLYSQQLWPARESQYKLTEINIKDTVLIEFLVITITAESYIVVARRKEMITD